MLDKLDRLDRLDKLMPMKVSDRVVSIHSIYQQALINLKTFVILSVFVAIELT